MGQVIYVRESQFRTGNALRDSIQFYKKHPGQYSEAMEEEQGLYKELLSQIVARR